MHALARGIHFELESEWRRAREGGEGISTAFTNIKLRMAVSSPANDVPGRDLTITGGGMVSERDSGCFSSPGTADGLPPNLKSLLSRPFDGREFKDPEVLGTREHSARRKSSCTTSFVVAKLYVHGSNEGSVSTSVGKPSGKNSCDAWSMVTLNVVSPARSSSTCNNGTLGKG